MSGANLKQTDKNAGLKVEFKNDGAGDGDGYHGLCITK